MFQQVVVMPWLAAAAKWVACAVGCIGGVYPTVGKVFVAAARNTQASGLNHLLGVVAVIFDQQRVCVEPLRVPVRYSNVQRAAQQRLPSAQALRLSWLAVALWVELLHASKTAVRADGIDHRVSGLEQDAATFALSAAVHRVAATGVVHVDGAGGHE